MYKVYKKGLSIFLVLLMVMGGISGVIVPSGGTAHAAGGFAGGDGSESNPYQIATADQLNEVRYYLDDFRHYYKLTADIDLSSYDNWEPIGSFTTNFNGKMDGNGFKITNLKIDRQGQVDIGLFGCSTGIITNIILIGVVIVGGVNVGGLAGDNLSGSISNSYATGSVTGTDRVGGLVGSNVIGTISNSYATGSVTGNDKVGGLVGSNYYSGTISNSYATGNVSGNQNVGGLVGHNDLLGIISNSYATGSVSGDSEYVGGLVGYDKYSQVPINNIVAAITGVIAPVKGATPVSTIATAEYTATINWSPTTTVFAGGTEYTAKIIITPDSVHTLTGVPANFFTVEGAKTTNDADSGIVTAVFPPTAVPIPTGAITGLTAPVAGATPVTAVTDSSEYTATVSWSPATTLFDSEKAYNATVTITPKAGYTLTGVPANFFTVAGAITTNAAGSGIVTAVFPATAAPIATRAIAGVTAPVTGATPVTTVTYSSEYTATVNWSPTTTLFAGGTAYTATITITSKAGYTITGVPGNFFTVAGATTTNAADSGVVTAVFPATQPLSTGSTFTLPTNNIVTSTNGTLTLPVNQAGEVSFEDAVKISIPAGAAVKELIVSIKKVLEPQKLFLNNELLLSPVYEITKNFAENFSKPVTLNISYDSTLVKSNQKAAVFYYDEMKKAWVEVAGGKIEGNHIRVEVNHFGKYAVLSVDEVTGLPVTEPVTGTSTKINLSDIAGHWAEISIQQAISMGMVKGYQDGTFQPNHSVTRAEFAVMLMNVLKPQGEAEKLTFTDTATIGAWAQTAVAQAVQAGIIKGYEDGGFRPNAEITRAEMAVILAKALGKSSEVKLNTSFADDKDIPAWAKSSVDFVKQAGMVQGKGDNEFAPQDSATRAEAVTVLLKLLAQRSS